MAVVVWDVHLIHGAHVETRPDGLWVVVAGVIPDATGNGWQACLALVIKDDWQQLPHYLGGAVGWFAIEECSGRLAGAVMLLARESQY